MNKLVLITLLGFLMLGCSSENEEAPAAEPEASATLSCPSKTVLASVP